MIPRAFVWLSIAVFVGVLPVRAELRLAYIFQDQAVLQRDKPVPVWGWADPGAEVTVSFAGQTVKAAADAEGYWRADLKSMPARALGEPLTVSSGSESIELKDVVVGEVWIAAGQSNMNHGGPDKDTGVFPFYQSPDGVPPPDIRFRWFGSGVSLEPQRDVPEMFRKSDSVWKSNEVSEKGGNLSLYFARMIRDDLKVPVGIIQVAVSGINQAAWMSKESLEAFPGSGGGNFYEQFLAEREAGLAKSKGDVKSFADFKKAEEAWAADPKGAWPGRTRLDILHFPTVLYNTRITPLAPYAVRGVIWHQGEAGPGGPYGERLVAMFKQWRELFGQDFDVIWGTLSKTTSSQPPLKPGTSGFYRSGTNNQLRLALDLFAGDERVEYVEFYDLGNEDTHFSEKAEAGRRMGLAALATVYDKPVTAYTGPRLEDSKIDGNKVTLKFAHTGEGLVYEPGIDGISGFFVYGDGKAAWAKVKLVDATTIECEHPDGATIEYVGYGLASNPHETLRNSDGISASPFSVNPDNAKPESEPDTVKLVKSEGGGKLHLSHVRQNGYIFELRDRKNAKTVPAVIYIPAGWSDVVVEQAGEKLTMEEVVEDGVNYRRITVALNQPVVVADSAHLEEFEKVDRY